MVKIRNNIIKTANTAKGLGYKLLQFLLMFTIYSCISPHLPASFRYDAHAVEPQVQDKTQQSFDIGDIDVSVIENRSKYEIIAVVNGRLITNHDLRQYVAFNKVFRILTKQKQMSAQKDSEHEKILQEIKSLEPENKPKSKQDEYKEYLNALILDYVKITTAEKMYGIKIPEKQVDIHLQNIAGSLGKNKTELLDILHESSITDRNINFFISALIMWDIIKNSLIAPRVRISNKQINETLEVMMRNYGKPEYLIMEIFISKGKDADAESINIKKTWMEKLRSEVVNKNLPFPTVAMKYSQSPSRNHGGIIGWISKEAMIKKGISKTDEIKKGYTSPVIETNEGFYIYHSYYERIVPKPVKAINFRHLSIKYDDMNTALKKAQEIRSNIKTCANMNALAENHTEFKISSVEKIDVDKIPDSLKKALPENISEGDISQPIKVGKEVRIFMACNFTESSLVENIKNQIGIELKEQVVALQLEEFLKIMILQSKIQLK